MIFSIWDLYHAEIALTLGILGFSIGFYYTWIVFLEKKLWIFKDGYLCDEYNKKYCEYVCVRKTIGNYRILEFRIPNSKEVLGANLQQIQL